MERILEEITEKINTKEDLILFLEEINILENLIFKDLEIPLSERAEKKIEESFRILLKKWEKEKIIPYSPAETFSFLEKLKKELQKLPQIKLEIAFQPSEDFISKIKKWFEDTLGKRVVLNFIINQELVAGVIIEYQGKREDFSLAKKITSFISQS